MAQYRVTVLEQQFELMSALTVYSTASQWKGWHLIMFARDIKEYWEWRRFGEVVWFEKIKKY